MRRGALLKVDQNIGMSPTSVGGGENVLGNCEASAGFCGPGSVKLEGLPRVLISPCGGSSGLPKVAALAAAAVAIVPAAAAVSTPRRDTDSMKLLLSGVDFQGAGLSEDSRKRPGRIYATRRRDLRPCFAGFRDYIALQHAGEEPAIRFSDPA